MDDVVSTQAMEVVIVVDIDAAAAMSCRLLTPDDDADDDADDAMHDIR